MNLQDINTLKAKKIICSACGQKIELHPEEISRGQDGEPICDDCYYDILGTEIEANPIGPGQRFCR